MSDYAIRYVIVKKYILDTSDQKVLARSIKVDMYKYWAKDQMMVDDIMDARWFESIYDAEHALKFTPDDGIFQIEKIYIKKIITNGNN